MPTKLRKIIAAIASLTLAFAIVLTGSYAWQSISQEAANESDGTANHGGRLHDDFDGTNKDVYVENFTDPAEGVEIYARIRLYEYMEIGEGAGLMPTDPGFADKTAVSLVTGATIDNKASWTIHNPITDPAVCDNGVPNPFHDYWSWEMGGETVFMPTFNKNKDSLAADINGTWAGSDGDRLTKGDKYDDYVTYTEGQVLPGTAIYDADADTFDEGAASVLGTNHTEAAEEHVAKKTAKAQVITMEEWKAMDCPVEPYWVYDTDGWAYWAMPIAPGEATGLLLDEIKREMPADDKWYYAINVVGQFATAGDWFTDEDGGKPSADALFLLNKAADRLPEVTRITIGADMKTYACVDEAMDLIANVTLRHPMNTPEETQVTWTVEPSTSALVGSKFIPSDADLRQTYTLTATSFYDPTFTASIDIYVGPAGTEAVVTGANNKTYVRYPDNTYKEFFDDNTLSDDFYCTGTDGNIGSADDETVIVLTPEDENFGGKFRPTANEGFYYAMGDDGKLGTADDVLVYSESWPNNIHVPTADTTTVTPARNVSDLRQDGELQFNAKVTFKDVAFGDQTVTWMITTTQQKHADTFIDENGYLTISPYETVGNIITVQATSTTGKVGKYDITVTEWTVKERIESVTPNSSTTIPIDGYNWYVVRNEGNRALLWAADNIGSRPFDANANTWEGSDLQIYLNGEFLNTLKTMGSMVQPTTFDTRTQVGSDAFTTSINKVFLFSEADINGQFNSAAAKDQDYTYGTSILITNKDMFAGTTWCWLRSPRNSASSVAGFNTIGSVSNNYYSNSSGVRPALWVNLPS